MAKLSTLSPKAREQLRYDWGFWGRPEQQLPSDDDWDVFLPLAGRGSGKTRLGAEAMHKWAANKQWSMALVGATAADIRDFMIHGPSGLLATQKPENPCYFRPSLRRVEWPKTGSYALYYSGDSPDQARGPNTYKIWCDELAKFQYPEELWDNLEFMNRLGSHPQFVVTTTPRPLKIIKALIKDAWTRVHRWSTYRNAVNLAPTTLRRVLARYEGTRIGRQELHAEILEDAPGALWKRTWIDDGRTISCPVLEQIVVGVDPPGGEITECGIVAAGLAYGKITDGYVLADDSRAGTPDEWSKQVWSTALRVDANKIVAESNHGGLMVRHTLETCRPAGCMIPIELVTASRGKAARAEPVAQLAEQRRLHHVGSFGLLEDELCDWEPLIGKPSPNRLDALVWAIYGLGMTGDVKYIQVW